MVEVTGVSTASDLQFRCVAQQSLAGLTFVEFPEVLNARYQRVYYALDDAASRIKARVWLSRRGLLDKVPIYRKGATDDLEFSRNLESVCGPSAAGTIQVKHEFVVLKFGLNSDTKIDQSTIECVMNVGWATGLRVGFIGNEYYPTKTK